MVLPVTQWFGSGLGQSGSTAKIGAILAPEGAAAAAAPAAGAAASAGFSGAPSLHAATSPIVNVRTTAVHSRRTIAAFITSSPCSVFQETRQPDNPFGEGQFCERGGYYIPYGLGTVDFGARFWRLLPGLQIDSNFADDNRLT